MNVGKTIVHEWAHLRYGLFDESNWENGENLVSCDTNSDDIPRCTGTIKLEKSVDEKTEKCLFKPQLSQKSGASLLYAPFIDSVNTSHVFVVILTHHMYL